MGMFKRLMQGTVPSRRQAFKSTSVSISVETFEIRTLLSGSSVINPGVENLSDMQSFAGASSAGYTPAQLRAAYGFTGVMFGSTAADGTGQTIAIIDAYDDPNIASDLATFDSQLGIAAPPSFKVVNQTGGTKLPRTDPQKGWEGETALDVEWAHAIAPGASILLVEANSASDADLFAAVDYARHVAGVSVISMSWGSQDTAANASYDQALASQYLVTPTGHQGITFIASTGDNGYASFPATDPNVLAVGGTDLYLNSNNTISKETAWVAETDSSGTVWSGGGGVSQEFSGRKIPDVSYNAGVGMAVYDTFGNDHGWVGVGGTSAGAPQWAGLIAIANQGRVAAGLGTLNGATQTLKALYAAPSADFHDITQGSTQYQAAGVGYDLATGLGTPVANKLIPYLAAYGSTTGTGGTGGTTGGSGGTTGGGGTTTTGLTAPTNVQATALSSTSAQLSWNSVSGATGYHIYQVINSKPVLLGTVSSSTTSVTITNLTSASKDTFIVEAYSGSTVADSNPVTVQLPTPAPVQTLQVTATTSSTSASLQWNAISGATSYRIYWSNGYTTVLLGSVKGSATSVQVTGLAPGSASFFLVEAVTASSVIDSSWILVQTKSARHAIADLPMAQSAATDPFASAEFLQKMLHHSRSRWFEG
ncbi:MAG: fibronectin type III domain-containing protein [Planctomycetales bacterium]